jgi:hypothetical protein
LKVAKRAYQIKPAIALTLKTKKLLVTATWLDDMTNFAKYRLAETAAIIQG